MQVAKRGFGIWRSDGLVADANGEETERRATMLNRALEPRHKVRTVTAVKQGCSNATRLDLKEAFTRIMEGIKRSERKTVKMGWTSPWIALETTLFRFNLRE